MGDARIDSIVRELSAWPGPKINSHKSASQFFHTLAFLAEFGLKADYPGMSMVVGKILEGLDEDGVPTLGGVWALCDAPITLYALSLMGVKDPRLDSGLRRLAAQPRAAGGYTCSVSASLGSWRGPGKQSEPCPYATLVMLKLFLQRNKDFPGEFDDTISSCAECLLDLWAHSREKHPYIFYMGTDFRKLKLPTIWYDILHVADVLSRVPGLGSDARLVEMLEVIESKRQPAGFVPESVYHVWKGWDFGQKKDVSPTMTEFIAEMGKGVAWSR
ncbi:MAG TPA: hypothetical protein VIO60_01275 [Rectinemataceae bacterium]